MPKSRSRKSASRKCHTPINDLVSGLGRVASVLWQKSKVGYPLSLTSLQAGFKLLSAVPIECSKLKRKAIDEGTEPPSKKRTLAQRNDMPLHKPSILNLLPMELFCEVGLFLDIEQLKAVILVCRLFCNIYLPIYLSRCKFSPGQMFFRLYKVPDFDVFRSYHRSQNLPLHASLSAEIDSNIQAKSLAYALAHLPTKTFATISLCFTHHDSRLGQQPLSELLTALVPMQCSKLDISVCLGDLGDRHHADISIAPIFTPMAFHLTDLKLDGDLGTTFFQPLLCSAAPSLEILTLLSFTGNPNHIFPAEGWKALLGSGEFPRLCQLKVSNNMPFSVLLEFLSHHSGISNLAIEADAEDIGLTHDTTQAFSADSLSAISGSPQYILALLQQASRPPSLSRLSLYAHHLPNSSILAETHECLALCQKVDALEVSFPHSNCQIAFHEVNKFPQLDFKMLGIKRFRLMFLDFTFSSNSMMTASNGDIVSAWKEWHKYIYSAEHFEFEEIYSIHDRSEVCRLLSAEFPSLAVSVRSGTYLIENQFAKDSGGFDFHVT